MTGTREVLVGVVIVAAVVLMVVGTLWLQGAAFGQDRTEVDAVFYQVGQVQSGNAVKLRGVEVGRIRQIIVDPDGDLVRLRLRIDERLSLPDDPVVVLSPESLFGDWQAEIQPRDRFPHIDFPSPPDAEVLPGHALPDISQLTVTADRISQDLAVLTERIGIAFSEETAENVASLIDNVQDVTERLADLVSQQATSFTEVTDEFQRATQGIGAAADQARVTMERVDGLIARTEVTETLEDLAVISSNLRSFSGELEGTSDEIREMTARVDSTFLRVDAIMARIEGGEGSVGRLIQDPTMAAEMENTLTELNTLLEDIRENPRRYLRLSIF